ncbi:helix-turn-helix domain-containing protein [Chitinophaga solisilvae]|uniref:helix-turn-helix domain-containing protein n=1 Tax=Chitinophaga solisilvae TaxID=1233460 RepID=UPI00136E282D|nr:helix-turn-helix domain-containing protein [Chitinophaga solisilvae]
MKRILYRHIIFSSAENPQLAQDMVRLICHALQLRIEVLLSGKNTKEVACARQVICYLLCRFTDISFAATGKVIHRSRPAVHYNFGEAAKHVKVQDELFMHCWSKVIPVLLQWRIVTQPALQHQPVADVLKINNHELFLNA